MKITFTRIKRRYIVKVNDIPYTFDTYYDAWTFIAYIRKEVA